jgi:regulation of enolase protein 1 (concanavalin A-like superfamily)
MEWMNEPTRWAVKNDIIAITADPKTDFWRRPGHIASSGHFYHQSATGDFVAEVKITGDYAALYDQAGMMVYADGETWIKCGIEYFNDIQHVSAVIARGFTDWAVAPLRDAPEVLWVRMKRHGPVVEVHYAFDGENYTMLRDAYFTEAETLKVGLLVAAPQGNGFEARFERFVVR